MNDYIDDEIHSEGAENQKDDDEYSDGDYEDDFDEEEEEQFKKTAAQFAQKLQQLKQQSSSKHKDLFEGGKGDKTALDEYYKEQ